MRDSNERMIELLEATKENGVYSSLIRHEINGEKLKLRFGIQPSDYGRLKRILEFRPFENTGVAPYRYFFSLTYRKKENDLAEMHMRVEQKNNNKQFEFELSQSYVANILWFKSIMNRAEVENLIEKE